MNAETKNKDDFIYSIDDKYYHDREDIVERINSGYAKEQAVSVFRGVQAEKTNKDFITRNHIIELICRIQESIHSEYNDGASKYLDKLSKDNIDDLINIISDYLDKHAKVNFYAVDRVDCIEIKSQGIDE